MANIKELPKHPEYKEKEKAVERNRVLYEADIDKLKSTKYIPLRMPEYDTKDGMKIYKARLDCTDYTNFFKLGISHWLGLLSKLETSITDEILNALPEIETNFDGLGKSMQACLLGEMAKNLVLYGRSVAYIDALNDGYVLKFLHPAQCTFWLHDESKELIKCLLYTQEVSQTGDIMSAAKVYEKAMGFTKLDNGTVQLDVYIREKEGAWRQIDQKILPVERIPVSFSMTPCLADDVALIALKLLKIDSFIAGLVAVQGANFRWIRVNATSTETKIDGMSEHDWFKLQQNEEVGQLDPVDPVAFEKERERAIIDFYRMILSLSRKISSDSKAVESAETIQQSVSQEALPLYLLIEELETHLNDVIDLIRIYSGISAPFTESVDLQLPQSAALSELMDLAVRIRPELDASPTLKKVIYREIASQATTASEPEIEDILKELERQQSMTPRLQPTDLLRQRANGTAQQRLVNVRENAITTQTNR